MLKTTYQHLPPSYIKYRCYKKFNTNYFLAELHFVTSYLPVGNYTEFDNAFKSVLDKHAPFKTKCIRGNNEPHMIKILRKAIMKRSHLKSIANKTKKSDDMQAYKKQRNIVVNLNKKAKRNLFNSIEVSPNQGSKTFWRVCKPLLSSKSNSGVGRILLIENNDILSDDKSIATVFNEYFNCITINLDLEKWDTCTSSLFNDPVSQAVSKYSNHPSIQKIKAKFNNSNKFEFMPTDENTIYKLIMQLDSSKKTGGDIPTKILKEAAVICSPLIASCVNSALSTGVSF